MSKKIILIFLFILFPILIGNRGINVLNTNNKIVNLTKFDKIEENLSKALLYLEIEGLVISIHEVPKELLYIENGITVNGFVIQENNCSFYLFLSPLLESDYLIEVLAHEVIHINQYYMKKLISISYEEVYWNDSLIQVSKTNYIDRPWEIEAFNGQHCLYEKIK